MKKSIALLVVAATIALAVPAFAELQNVVVGGELRVRGNWFDMGDANGPIGNMAATEQRTKLNVRADFTDNVSAFIELDAYNVWGDGFRSNYLTGVDARPAGGINSVAVYQSYIETKEMWGTPLKARIGRQEIKLGSGLLVGTNDNAPFFTGLSFDALRLTYATDQFSVDAIVSKLADTSPAQEDGDTDLYAVYGSYLGIENVTLDAYWLFVRDASAAASLDTHTFGLRGAGTVGAFDFELEAAYQLIDFPSGSGIDSSDAFAVNGVVGYLFDCSWTPRVFLSGAFFSGGGDSRDDQPFNRLFSDGRYSKFLDRLGADRSLTDFWTVQGGVSANPVESVKLELSAAYYASVDDYNLGVDKEIGVEVGLSALYKYTSDLAFKAGYAHFFPVGDDDIWVRQVGMGFGGLTLLDDMNYYYMETQIKF